jgi:hypothetical protein
VTKAKPNARSRPAENNVSLPTRGDDVPAKQDFPRDSVGKVVPPQSNEASGRHAVETTLLQGGTKMDQKSFEINRLNLLNECLCQTIEVLARAQRIGSPTGAMGLSHSPFVPNLFGVPTMDPRAAVDYPGFAHSGYNYGNAYPFGYNAAPIAGWPAQYTGAPQTHVDPFLRERVGLGGLSHTSLPNTPWAVSPYAAEIERQRIQALYARQQYEALATGWRPFGI